MQQIKRKTILGIETSCDETAAAIVSFSNKKFTVHSNIIRSQINIHKKYGGVVPEVAARQHIISVIAVIEQALETAQKTVGKIDAIAVTAGPGLITSLMVGVQTAKTLSYIWNKPLIAVNHMKAHVYANWINNKKIKFPAICLIVSGGHTELVLLKKDTHFKKIGQTVDDAAGEAFDKTAQLIKLEYPGGPEISKSAATGNPNAFTFPRPMINSGDFNFSFSGLKTAVLYTVKKQKKHDSKMTADLAASFQQAVVDVLTIKTAKAAKKYQAKSIMLAGGVAANKLLRETLQQKAADLGTNFYVPDIQYCTDNAAMIAVAGYFTPKQNLNKIKINPNLEL